VPTPTRGAGGHRRYQQQDVDLVLEVVRQRAGGLSMQVAVDRARSHQDRAEPSVFAGLHRRYPELRVQQLRKPTLLALCHAIEDECCAQAEQPLLFASFQRTAFYRGAKRRWAELGRTALTAIVFADFDRSRRLRHRPEEVRIPFDAPLNREWVLVCDAADYPGCVVAWEPPGNVGEDSARRFEAVWSVNPRVVRHAARICASLSEEFRPGTAYPEWGRLQNEPPEPTVETRRAGGVLDRMLTYLSAADG